MGDLSLEDQNFVQRQTELIAATDDDSDDFVGDIILQVRPAIRDQDYFPPDNAVTAIQGTGVVQNGVGVGVEGIGGQVGSAGTGIGVRGIGVNDGIGVHGLGGEDALGVGVIGQGGYGGDNQAAVFGGVGVMGLSGGAEVPAPDINNLTTKNVGVFGRGYGNSSVGVRGEARYVLPDGNTDSDGMHAEGGRWGIQAVGEAAGIHAVSGKRGRGGEFSAGIANIRLKPAEQNYLSWSGLVGDMLLIDRNPGTADQVVELWLCTKSGDQNQRALWQKVQLGPKVPGSQP